VNKVTINFVLSFLLSNIYFERLDENWSQSCKAVNSSTLNGTS
jgi:hypothetical protein